MICRLRNRFRNLPREDRGRPAAALSPAQARSRTFASLLIGRAAIVLALSPLAAFLCAGCSSGREISLPVWRASVEEYIREEANGDPNSLRDVENAAGRKEFSVFGQADPDYSTDAIGLLLGHKQIGQKYWFVFLTGLVVEEQVEDIRVAALNAEGEKYTWAFSGPNGAELKRYLRYKRDLWRARFTTKRAPPPAYTTFATETDYFTVDIDGNRITVTHPPSGARWAVKLDDAAGKSLAAAPLAAMPAAPAEPVTSALR